MAESCCEICGHEGYWLGYDSTTDSLRCANHVGTPRPADEPVSEAPHECSENDHWPCSAVNAARATREIGRRDTPS